MPIIKIVDASTGEEIEREMNAEELAQWQKDKAKAEAEVEAKADAAAAKSALLERLGLSEQEAKLLLS